MLLSNDTKYDRKTRVEYNINELANRLNSTFIVICEHIVLIVFGLWDIENIPIHFDIGT